MALVLVGCRAGPAGDGASGPGTLRVMTYNIHHGRGMDGVIDLKRIAAVIKAAEPDLVALQEVDQGVERTGRVDQPAVLAALTGMHVVFEKNIDYQGGEYGNAVLSRFPIRRHTNHQLPSMYEGEQRGLLEVHVMHGGRPVVFYATHFEYRVDDTERLASADMLRGLIEAQAVETLIVAGDINARPDSAVLDKLTAFLNDAYASKAGEGYTFPADTPDRRIDYIMSAHGSGLHAVTADVIDEPVASDHRPLFVVFEVSVIE